MRVSVVVSVFKNVSDFEITLGSISRQTIQEVEILVVDDGNSEEDSVELERICKSESRVRIIKNDINIGLTGSLIKACNQARAPYIARIDNGDLMVPENRLEMQLESFESDPGLAVVGGQIEIVDTLNGAIFRSKLEIIDDSQLRGFPLSVSRFHHVTVMMSKTAYRLSGGYDSFCRTGQDRELWPRLMDHGKGLCLPVVFSVAPMRFSSISVARNNEQIRNKIVDMKRKWKNRQITLLQFLISFSKCMAQLTMPVRLRVFLRYYKNMQFVKFIPMETAVSFRALKELYS